MPPALDGDHQRKSLSVVQVDSGSNDDKDIFGYFFNKRIITVAPPVLVDSSLTIDGLLDSNGICVDIGEELLSEMELLVHPDKAKKITEGKEKKNQGINDSFYSQK